MAACAVQLALIPAFSGSLNSSASPCAMNSRSFPIVKDTVVYSPQSLAQRAAITSLLIVSASARPDLVIQQQRQQVEHILAVQLHDLRLRQEQLGERIVSGSTARRSASGSLWHM